MKTTAINKITVGKHHALYLTINGKSMALASNRLNHSDFDDGINVIMPPMLIKSFADIPIVDISTGENHLLCLAQQGTLFSFDTDTWGVLRRDADLPSKEVGFSHCTLKLACALL